MERNRRRERVVSEDTMQKMAERLRPPSFKEGFSKITVVRVKGSGPSAGLAAAPDTESEPEQEPALPEEEDAGAVAAESTAFPDESL